MVRFRRWIKNQRWQIQDIKLNKKCSRILSTVTILTTFFSKTLRFWVICHKLKTVRCEKNAFFGEKCVNQRKKNVFSALFFRDTAVRFQIKYDELQNPKTCKHYCGGCFWSNKVESSCLELFWVRSGLAGQELVIFRKSFELLLDAKPCFLPLRHQTKLLPTFLDGFQDIFKHFRRPHWKPLIVFLVKLCRDLPENKMSINNSYVVPYILSAGEEVNILYFYERKRCKLVN